MVIETRGGAQIGVLNEKVQGIQQQVEEHSNQFGLINVKVDRMESNFGEFKATLCGFQSTLCGFQSTLSSFQSMMEERLPKPAEMNHQPQAGRNVNHAPSSIRVQPSFGEQLPTTPPSIHRLPIGAKERNALSMRAPNHEEQTMVQPEPQREAQLGQGGGAPIVGKQPSIFEPIEPIPTRAESRNVRPMRAPNHEVHFNPNQPRFGMPYDDPFEPRRKRLNGGVFLNPIVESLCGSSNARPPPSFEGQCGLYGEEYWHEKRLPRQQGQQGQQAQPQRHASQAREPRNAPWPQGDVVEPWYDHGGGKGNWGRARNYQGPQDRDPYGKNQDPLQRQQGRQAREPRAMKLEFPRFKGGDPTSWMFRAIQYFEYYQVHDASKVMHASYHLDDDALIWFKSCEHDLGCWDNFARAIQLRGCLSHLAIGIRNLSSMHKLSCFMSGLKDEVRLAIKMQGPRTLGEAYALAKIQEQYLANVKGSTRPSYEANKDNWEQYSSQEVAAQFVPKVATQVDPKVIAQLDPKVAVQGDPKVATQLNPKVAAQMDPKVVDPKPTSAKPTMMVQKLTPKQMLERRRKGLCYYCDESWTMWHTCKAMKLYLIEEVQEEEGAYVTSYEEEERVEWGEERRNTKEESINNDIQVPSRYWLIGRSPLMKKHLTKKQLEDSSSIRPQQDHNLEDKVF
uniref:Ty3 transposon capsid-like protein domain-containing protein n=1 Tax=Fagus sylvatica TaxID=28930 RepID=A0A2N9HHS0_FAGSY